MWPKTGMFALPFIVYLYIDDLIRDMKLLNIGIEIGEKTCILLYSDDVNLIADTEENLQSLLNCLNEWSARNGLKINKDKSKIVHFRRLSVQRSVFNFSCGEMRLDLIQQYKYFGLILHEHLDYSITAKAVAQSASRASYGASIWGTREYS